MSFGDDGDDDDDAYCARATVATFVVAPSLLLLLSLHTSAQTVAASARHRGRTCIQCR
jgi:hypothetical protein